MYHQKPQGWFKHIDFILWDVLCLHLAFVLAYITRHGWENPYGNRIYFNIIFVYTAVDLIVLIVNHTLKNVLKRGLSKEFAQTLKHTCLVELIIFLYLFSTQDGIAYSRITLYLLAGYYFVATLILRILWKKLLIHKFGVGRRALFVIASQDRAADTVECLRKEGHGYSLLGLCILDRDAKGETVSDVAVTANAGEVLAYLCDKWVDEVYIATSPGQAAPRKLIETLAEMGIVLHVELEDDSGLLQRQAIERLAGRTVRTISMTMASTGQIIFKRALDILGGLIGCLITLLLTLIIGPIIFIKSPGPIFFTQIRVGKNGKKFKMYKFRSMYRDAEARKAELMKENRVKDGLMFKLEFDPRIIGCVKRPDGTIKKGIGNFIRDFSLDEFPQFFNVLKGDLSLCGTRPPTVDEWEKYDLHHRARLAIKPGITGLWQVSGRSNITDFEQVVELDKKYIREWSLGLDFKILLQTIKVVLGRDGSM